MAIGDSISEPIPPVGTAGTSYATQLVAFLTEVKARLEAKVPLTSILIGALDMANNALTNVASVGLYESASQPSTPVGSIQRYGNNLWYVSNAGAFQMTNGAALNATGIDGITGDYGSPNPAELRFVDADQEFYFYDNFGTGAWARVKGLTYDVAAGATSSVRARIDFGGGSSYTLTLPASVPGAGVKTMLSLDENGDILQTGTVTTNITAADFKHTTAQVLEMSCDRQGGTGFGLCGGTFLAASDNYTLPIDLPVGAVITEWAFIVQKTTNGSNNITARIMKHTLATDTFAGQGTLQQNTAANPGIISMGETGTSFTLSAGEAFVLSFVGSAWSGGGLEKPIGLKISWTRPT